MAIGYKLVPFGSKAVKEGYRAVVDNNGYVKDSDDILQETADRFGLKPEMLRMCLEAVLGTMMNKVAEDGIRRRFGDFFTLRLDIKGRFNGKDSKPDGSQRPQFKLQLLGEFKKAARKIRLRNEQTRKRIYLESIVSDEKPAGKGKIFWGMTISFYGMNLLPILEGDRVDWCFTDANGEAHSGTCGAPFIPNPMFVQGNRTTVSWQRCKGTRSPRQSATSVRLIDERAGGGAGSVASEERGFAGERGALHATSGSSRGMAG